MTDQPPTTRHGDREDRGIVSLHRHDGGCHCGALRWQFDTARALQDFAPRACDCDFCTRHGAAWLSDPDGRLRVHAHAGSLQRYRQGSRQADFLLCRDCGVLVAVIAPADTGRWLGALNRNAFDGRASLTAGVPASPQALAPAAKRARWDALWTPTELAQDA